MELSDPARGTRGLQPERDGRVRCSAWLDGVIHSEQTDRVIVVAFVTVTLWQCRHRVNGTEARPLIGGNSFGDYDGGGAHEEPAEAVYLAQVLSQRSKGVRAVAMTIVPPDSPSRCPTPPAHVFVRYWNS